MTHDSLSNRVTILIVYELPIISTYFSVLFKRKLALNCTENTQVKVCRTRHGAPFTRMMNDSVTTRQYRNKTRIPSSSFPITYDRDKTHFCNAVYQPLCTAKSPAVKSRSERKEEKKKQRERENNTAYRKIRLPRPITVSRSDCSCIVASE